MYSKLAAVISVRLGGDEFTVILEQIGNVPDASVVAKKIIDTIALPIFLNDHEV